MLQRVRRKLPQNTRPEQLEAFNLGGFAGGDHVLPQERPSMPCRRGAHLHPRSGRPRTEAAHKTDLVKWSAASSKLRNRSAVTFWHVPYALGRGASESSVSAVSWRFRRWISNCLLRDMSSLELKHHTHDTGNAADRDMGQCNARASKLHSFGRAQTLEIAMCTTISILLCIRVTDPFA